MDEIFQTALQEKIDTLKKEGLSYSEQKRVVYDFAKKRTSEDKKGYIWNNRHNVYHCIPSVMYYTGMESNRYPVYKSEKFPNWDFSNYSDKLPELRDEDYKSIEIKTYNVNDGYKFNVMVDHKYELDIKDDKELLELIKKWSKSHKSIIKQEVIEN